MRWRYIIAALLGGLIGFAGHFALDFVSPDWKVPRSTIYGLLTASLPGYGQSCMRFEDLKFKQKQQAKNLVDEACVLWWLQSNGEAASRTAAIAALLVSSSMFAADRLRQSRKARREATG